MSKQYDDVVTGNTFDKYRTKNPIYQWLMSRFLDTAFELAAELDIDTALEVGCGPGDLAKRLLPNLRCNRYVGTDIGKDEIEIARKQNPAHEFQVADVYSLPFSNKEFDLTIACEVMEHLKNPHKAIQEISRVTKKHLLLSVPSEPWWRLLNMSRLKYIRHLGNTPGHLQHFSPKSITSLVSNDFQIIDFRRPFPWLMLIAEKK